MSSTKADFSQNDGRWSGKLLGFSGWEKIGPYGCFVTAMANVAQAQGTNIDPNGVNDQLKAHGQFVRDSYGQIADVAGYGALSIVAPHSHFVEQKNWPGTVVAPAAYFDVRNTTSTEIIIMIDAHPEQSGIQSHFVRVIGLLNGGKDLEIIDSWDGKRKGLSAYANRAHKTPFQVIWTAGKYQKV
jgi:hypothetical protein